MTWNTIKTGHEQSWDFCITEADMLTFAELSEDRNSIHLDPASARNQGFDDVVVYGALIISKISALLGMRLPGDGSVWTSLDLNFVNPLYVSQSATVTATVKHLSGATGLIVLSIRVDAGNRRIAKGSAECLLRIDD